MDGSSTSLMPLNSSVTVTLDHPPRHSLGGSDMPTEGHDEGRLTRLHGHD